VPAMPAPEPPPMRERYRAHARHEVKQAALHQLAESGPAAVSISAIGKQPGVSGSALYRYFTSRDELPGRRLVRPSGPGLRSLDRSGLQPFASCLAHVARSRRALQGLAGDPFACSRPRGISMTLYMYQASYTAKSMAAQLTEPHDPMEAIRPTLEDLGATLLVAGFPFGEYDVLIVYEAPDDVTAASVAMAVAAAGEVKSAKTTRLLSGQEWLESLRKRRIVKTRKAPQPHDHRHQSPESL
jgi:uncharacterized protein with GYD domain